MHTRRSQVAAVFFSLVVSAAAFTAAAATREVCPSGCDYSVIQYAINASSPGDTVLVHPATYVEHLNFLGKAITVRSSGGAAATIINALGGGRVVTFENGETPLSVLEGFTLTGGVVPPGYHGGGIYCIYAAPTIRDCVITGNMAGNGGGIAILYSAPIILGCTVSSNSGEDQTATGGIYLYGPGADASISYCVILNNTGKGVFANWSASPTIRHCTVSGHNSSGIAGWSSSLVVTDSVISGNTYDGRGAGISLSGGAPRVSRCVIENNQAVEPGGVAFGGGIDIRGSAIVEDCVIRGNLADEGGGIAMAQDVYPIVRRCLITGNGNFDTFQGGGINISNVAARIESCTISGNWALVGAGIEIGDHPADPRAPTIVNSTIASNYGQASNHGGAGIHVFESEATPVVRNCILWGNYARGGSGNTHEIELEGVSTIDITYSNVAGGWTGVGNKNVDPDFVAPLDADRAPTSGGDYHLLATSDCIDAGTATDAATTDIDFGLRPWGSGYDMGSDEYGATSLIFADGFESGNTSGWTAAVP